MSGDYYAAPEPPASMSLTAQPAATASDSPAPRTVTLENGASPSSVEVSRERKWHSDPSKLTLGEQSELRRELRRAGMPKDADAEDIEDYAVEGVLITAVILARRDDPTLKLSAWRSIQSMDDVEVIAQPDVSDPADPTGAA